MNVPVFIINHNRLTSTRQLIDWLLDAGTEQITILDNKSTYAPLLDYYESLPERVTWFSMGGNLGRLCFWTKQLYKVQDTPYIITDADCVPSAGCPKDLVGKLVELLKQFPNAGKVGTGLRIDNLPDFYTRKAEVISWESKYWQKRACAGAFYANIDTTFALYPAHAEWCNHEGNVRTDFPYVVEHLPWYVDDANPSEEERYYREHVVRGDDSHW